MKSDNPFPPGAAVAAYLRDSGGEDQDLSTDQQQSEITAWCRANGIRLARVFADAARPGSSTVGREQFHALMEHFRNGASEAGIIIWRSNRLGRNVNDTQFHKADLRRRGYIVHSLMDDIPEGPAGQLVEFVLDWKDQIFLDQLSQDVKRGLHQNLKRYGVIPGTPPRGFRRVLVQLGQRRDGTPHTGYRWEPDPAQMPLVRRAFEMRAQGYTLKQIQAEIPFYKSASCWATFFDNELYTGVLHFGETTLPEYCPPIVPAEIWQAVQAQRRIKHQSKHPRRVGSGMLLSGLVICQQCGHALKGHNITGNQYYICAYRKRTGQCHARHIPARPLDDEITRLALEHILNPEHARALQTRMLAQTPARLSADKQTLRHTHAAHVRIKREISNIVAAIRAAGHSPSLLSELSGLEETERITRAQIEDLLERTQPQPQPNPADLDTYIATQRAALLDPATRRMVLKQLLHTIRALRTDDQIIVQLEYSPPHLSARQGRAFRSREGVPLGALTIDLKIPIRKRKAPRR